MKKHELIKHAYDNYPKGTKFINAGINASNCISYGLFEWSDDYNGILNVPNGSGIVYIDGKWAEIVPEKPEKIAVKAESEAEFKALMKYYDSLGWVSIQFEKPNKIHYNGNFGWYAWYFNNEFYHATDNYWFEKGYKIIPFSEFAEQKGIKVPLLISEDGVELHEGDNFVIAEFIKNRWIYSDFYANPFNLSKYSIVITEPNKHKAFSTKKAALEWIEKQNKPKFKEVNGMTVSKNRVDVSEQSGISKNDLIEILKTMEELKTT